MMVYAVVADGIDDEFVMRGLDLGWDGINGGVRGFTDKNARDVEYGMAVNSVELFCFLCRFRCPP